MTKEELIRKLEDKGFSRPIIKAFQNVDRETFIPPEHRRYAYEDMALPIGEEQTISQPYTIAFMLDLLELGESQKILEVGSGSGYVMALIDEIAENAEIFGTELVGTLVDRSQSTLKTRGNIHIYHTPSSLGLKDKSPFDRVLVSAAAGELPQELADQLNEGGILVCPVGNSIIKAVKQAGGLKTEEYPGFAFVPLITERIHSK